MAQTPIKVTVTQAQNRPLIQQVPLTGSVTASRLSLLSTEVAGLVKTLDVDAGDPVAAGDLLVALDPELSEIALRSAQAAAAQAREALADSERRLAEAQALARQNNIAASDVRSLEAQVRIDSATLQETQTLVQQRRAELARHNINAPFAGTVSRKLTEEGEWVAPGTDVLELVATDQLRIDLPTPARYFPRINQETVFELQFDAFPNRRYNGILQRKVPLADSNRTFLLRLHLGDAIDSGDNTPPALIAGMSTSAVMKLHQGQGLTIPRDALLRYPDGRISAWVTETAGENNQAVVTERFVKTGIAFDKWVAIESGLQAGDSVVVKGNESLRDGQTVTITTQ